MVPLRATVVLATLLLAACIETPTIPVGKPVAEPAGRVHAVYDAQRTAPASMSRARHAHIGPAAADDTSAVREIAGRHVRAAQRFDVLVTGMRTDSRSGSDRPLFYLQFRAGRWSAPVEVADARVDTLFGWIWDAVQIASDGHERVLVIWPARDGIEARWLRVKTE